MDRRRFPDDLGYTIHGRIDGRDGDYFGNQIGRAEIKERDGVE
jgi:hypothetical protein